MYNKHQISYKLNRARKSFEYWGTLPLTPELLTIIVFMKNFGAKYDKPREIAENELAEKGECKYIREGKLYEFKNLSCKFIESRKLSNRELRKIMFEQGQKAQDRPKTKGYTFSDRLFGKSYYTNANYL